MVDLTDIEKLSLHTLTLLLINLPSLQVSALNIFLAFYASSFWHFPSQLYWPDPQILDHNHLHEALWMMHKTGMDNRYPAKLLSYFF